MALAEIAGPRLMAAIATAGIVDYAVDDLFGHIRINGNRVARNLSKFPRELIRARKLGF